MTRSWYEDSVCQGLIEAIREGGGDPGLATLGEDLATLGYVGLCLSLGEPLTPDMEVFEEVRGQLRPMLQELSGQQEGSLLELRAAFLERYPKAGWGTFHKRLLTILFDFYQLKDHGLFIDDLGRVLTLFSHCRPGAPIHAFFTACADLSRKTGKFLLGLFPQQYDLIYKLSSRTDHEGEVEHALSEFAPRVLGRRLYGVTQTLINEEVRFRLLFTLYGRFHGLVTSKSNLLDIADRVADPKQVTEPDRLIGLALATADARQVLVEHYRAHAAAIAELYDLMTPVVQG